VAGLKLCLIKKSLTLPKAASGQIPIMMLYQMEAQP
jgi:hypothetical protein